MIAYLQGAIILRQSAFVILDVNGIGYKVFLTEKTLSRLSENERTLKLFTYLHLKEETAEIYGFLTYSELELFEALNGISGIGPRTALALSAFGSIEKLKAEIDQQGEKIFREVKGIGAKRLQKIALEITGKIKEMNSFRSGVQDKDQAVEGLVSLGFSRQKAMEALSQLPDGIKDTEQRVKESLKILGRQRR